MSRAEDLIRADLLHRGVQFTAPQGRAVRIAVANEKNYWEQWPSGTPRRHLGIAFHSTEDAPDGNDQTPRWFQNPAAGASTIWYVSASGRIFKMLPDAWFAWAQGTRRKAWRDRKGNWQRPNDRYVVEGKPRPDWMPPAASYNTFLESIEIEGFAASLEDKFNVGTPQYDSLCKLAGWLQWVFEIPDEGRWVTHESLCTWKTDPGPHFESLMPQIYAKAQEWAEQFEQAAQRIAQESAPEAAESDSTPAASSTPQDDQNALWEQLEERVASLEAGPSTAALGKENDALVARVATLEHKLQGINVATAD